MNEVMTPDHLRWNEFLEALCDKNHLDAPDVSGTTKCDNTHQHTRAILKEMGGFNIEETIKFFEGSGSFCDCEVVFNVDQGSDTDEENED